MTIEKPAPAVIVRHEEISSDSSWVVIGQWLDRVATDQSWRSEARSFSVWLTDRARQLGLSDASMWRFLTATRSFEVIRQDLLDYVWSCPELEEIADLISPEAIELASKIRRFAPSEELWALFFRLTQGRVTRAELRDVWSRYRALEGKKRPRASSTPLGPALSPPLKSKTGAPLGAPEAGVTAFADMPELFCSREDPRLCLEFHNPVLTGQPRSPGLPPLADRVIVVQESEQQPVRLHGLFDLGRSGKRRVLERLVSARPYFDAIWLVQFGWPQGMWSEVAGMPDVGVVDVNMRRNECLVLRGPKMASENEVPLKAMALQSLLASVLVGDGSLQSRDPYFQPAIPGSALGEF